MLSVDQVRFTPDGTSACFTAVEIGGDGCEMLGHNCGLWSVPADGSAPPRRLTDAETVHLIPGATIETTPHGALVAAEHRGAVELLLVPYDGGEPETLMSGRRQVEGVARTDSIVVAAVADPGSCGELIALADGAERGLTSFAAVPSPLPLAEITATAPDGYPVHGWIVRPAGLGPHPVLLMIHGGPSAQYGWRLFDEAQVYADAGYAVVLGNPRGSSGYGQAHATVIVGDAARLAASDLLALLDAALATGGLDGSRTGVLGGSYGGYMTTWLAAHHGGTFKAAVSERAVNAVDSFQGSSDIGWFFAADLWGADSAKWPEQSPLTYADRISIPMLIIHSEHDWRCPVEQAQRLFVALRLRGIPAEMLLFPGEGHELTRSGRPSHRAARLEAVLDWWSRHL
jgi:dipeptidyl aminopeptidase/acylaminoacyl peptidase